MITRRTIMAGALMQAARLRAQSRVERWGLYDVNLGGPSEGNPYMDVRMSAVFRNEHRTVEVDGFYDGNGSYKVRFSPDAEGEWSYTSKSNRRELDGKTGSFVCTKPAAGNHGPVGVRNTHHFGYADGTPYFPFGTTCYAWTHQSDELQQQTVNTLHSAPFNKMRMCIFPKWYAFNRDRK